MKLSDAMLEKVTVSLQEGVNPSVGSERRREPRTAFNGRATIVRCDDAARRTPLSVRIRDLSASGVGIHHSEELQNGDRFILLLPPAMAAVAKGVLCTVTNCRPAPAGGFDIGAMFTNLLRPTNEAAFTASSPPAVSQPTLPVHQVIEAFRTQLKGVLSDEELRVIQSIEDRVRRAGATSTERPKAPVVDPPRQAEIAPPPVTAPPGQPRPAKDVSQLLSREECIKRTEQAMQARTLSGVVAQVISLAASPRGNLAELASLVARDPLLSARILQAANSVSYTSTRGVVSTIPEAVRNIGCASVRDIAASLGVFDAMPPCSADGFNPIRCWQHSFAVATLCQRLSGDTDSGLAYLIGLCHDLGEILFQTHFGAEYRQVLEAQEATGRRRDELERKMLGMTHGEMVLTILRCMGLPETIRNPIEAFHNAGVAGRPANDASARILRVADLYANGLLLPSSVQAPLIPLTRPECRNATGEEHPARPDAVSLRSEIFALTAMLARLSSRDETSLMTAPYPHKSVRVWLARDPSLSSFDPIAAALESLADVTVAEQLPGAQKLAELRGLVVVSRSTTAPGFGALEITKAMAQHGASPLPLLWLTGRIDGPMPGGLTPTLWPVPLSSIAEFVARLG